jgi:hypothetical protein
MMTFTQVVQLRYPWAVLTTFVLVVLPGCGGNSGGNSMEPEAVRILTSVELHPTSSTLSVLEPLNTVALQVVAFDQDGRPMTDAAAVTFASANELVARVREGSTVSAVTEGQTVITAAVNIRGITKTGNTGVSVVAEREPALVGTWSGTVAGSLGSSNVVFVLTADATMSVVGDASWTRCRTEGRWELSGNGLFANGRDVECGNELELTFTAPLSNTQQLSGSWVAGNGHSGTFSFRKE